MAKAVVALTRTLCIGMLFLFQQSCGVIQTEKSPLPLVTVAVEDDFRVGFSGKGAGAGVMLSASMGPMGIAIGVAIDEGIAKKIRENIAKTDITIERSIRLALQPLANNLAHDIAVTLEELKFVTTSKEGFNDAVKIVFTLKVPAQNNTPANSFNTATAVQNGTCTTDYYELNAIKQEPAAVGLALTQAAACVSNILNMYYGRA